MLGNAFSTNNKSSRLELARCLTLHRRQINNWRHTFFLCRIFIFKSCNHNLRDTTVLRQLPGCHTNVTANIRGVASAKDATIPDPKLDTVDFCCHGRFKESQLHMLKGAQCYYIRNVAKRTYCATHFFVSSPCPKVYFARLYDTQQRGFPPLITDDTDGIAIVVGNN